MEASFSSSSTSTLPLALQCSGIQTTKSSLVADNTAMYVCMSRNCKARVTKLGQGCKLQPMLLQAIIIMLLITSILQYYKYCNLILTTILLYQLTILTSKNGTINLPGKVNKKHLIQNNKNMQKNNSKHKLNKAVNQHIPLNNETNKH